jgi:hypothetical protein
MKPKDGHGYGQTKILTQTPTYALQFGKKVQYAIYALGFIFRSRGPLPAAEGKLWHKHKQSYILPGSARLQFKSL